VIESLGTLGTFAVAGWAVDLGASLAGSSTGLIQDRYMLTGHVFCTHMHVPKILCHLIGRFRHSLAHENNSLLFQFRRPPRPDGVLLSRLSPGCRWQSGPDPGARGGRSTVGWSGHAAGFVPGRGREPGACGAGSSDCRIVRHNRLRSADRRRHWRKPRRFSPSACIIHPCRFSVSLALFALELPLRSTRSRYDHAYHVFRLTTR